MADKSFHLRANEIRAESRAYMDKLRSERLAKSRHKPGLMTNAVKLPALQPLQRPATAIIASRKVQAAVAPAVETVAVVPAMEPVFEDAPAVPAHVTAPIQNSLSRPKRMTLKVRKSGPKATIAKTPVPAEPVTPPAAILVPALTAKPKKATKARAAPAVKPAIEPAMDAAVPVIPEIVRARPNERIRPVSAIIEAGLEPVAAMQQVVAAAMATEIPPQATRSGRANETISSVPTLGPGMIWRLNQLGIVTLGDLAMAEVDDLRARLGTVAKLVRVENWIVFARAA
jgi:hypothetical protein